MFNIQHAKSCQKSIADCKLCEKNMEAIATMPLNTANQFLSDIAAPRLHNSFASVALENLITRTTHESQRAKADVLLGMGLFTAYQKRGGGL